MPILQKFKSNWVYGLYLLMVTLSALFGHFRYQAMWSFNESDLSYYLEFSSKVFNSKSQKFFVNNPGGMNLFHLEGTDGARSLHQAIHFEPIKYFFALLYSIANTPTVLFVFFGAIYFLPLLYLQKHYQFQSALDRLFFILFNIVYCLLPATLFATTFDLRPYSLLIPTFSLAVLSIHYRRNLLETLLFYNIIFLVREEALFFGALLMLFFTTSNDLKSQSVRKTLLILVLNWLFWGVLIGIYYVYSDFHYSLSSLEVFGDNKSFFIIFSILAISVLISTLYFLRKKKVIKNLIRILPILLSVLPFLLIMSQWINFSSPRYFFGALMYDPRWLPIFTILLLVLLVVFTQLSERFKSKIVIFLSVTALVSLFFSVVPLKHSPLSVLLSSFRNRNETKPIYELRKESDRYTTFILTDLKTHALLYDYDKAFLYYRLPAFLFRDQERFFPANAHLLVSLIKNKVDYIAISKNNEDSLKILAMDKTNLKKIYENLTYIVLRVERK